jgi:exopolysaccharide biosynthesis polyprenyl glycosylphosphotransferase
MTNRSKKIAVMIADFLILALSLLLALALRRLVWPDWSFFLRHFLFFLPIFLIQLAIFYIAGLYDFSLMMKARSLLARLGNSVLASTAAAVAYFYLFPDQDLTPKTTLIIFAAVSLVLLFSWRQISTRLSGHYLPKIKIGVIGLDKHINNIRQEIANRPYLGLELAASFDLEQEMAGIKEEIIIKGVSRLIISSRDIEARPKISAQLLDCLDLSLSFTELSDFYEQISGKVPLDEIDRLWFLDNVKENGRRPYNIAKRAEDLTTSLIILLISLPFWPFIALAIKLESKGPILFRQTRLGRNGKTFDILKFRTMREEGNDRSMTADNDQRVTNFGKFLRNTRLDEIPQMINIIRGEMSLIGPRPERPELVEELAIKIPYYRTRLLIKPGLTGWDQVSGQYHSASIEDTYEKLQYDLFYLKHRSFYLDSTILLKTITTVLGKMGR